MTNELLSSDDQDLMRRTILDVFGPDGVDLLDDDSVDDVEPLDIPIRPLADVVAEIDAELHGSAQSPRTLASIAKTSRKRSADAKFIVIQLHQSVLAVPISHVLEVQRVPAITSIPNVPDWLRGVTNLRGEIISVVDGRTFLNLPPNDHGLHRRLIIIQSLQQERWAGFIVDRVIGMRSIDPNEIKPSISPTSTGASRFCKGELVVGLETVGIMDLELLLSCEEMNLFASA
ncbi:MAG: CheW protein [Planctomycetaceae bacterium]|nr:CheW protein [Planctomycetaceae bacterium]